MSFEAKLKQAEALLEQLNESDLSLDESVKLYKEGLSNIKQAREMLEKAKLEVKEIESEDEENE